MANASIKAAFERMWQHIIIALNNKADKNIATTTTDGLMSADDKTKLDSLLDGEGVGF